MAPRANGSPAPQVAGESAALLDCLQASGRHTALIEFVREGVRKKKRARRRTIRAAAASCVVVLLLFWAVPYFRSTETLKTPAAHRQQFTLADGSETELSARTEIKTDFRYGRRHIHLLHGEAFFSVASDPAHPFLVETPRGQIRVTGTRFNVRLSSDGPAIVTLYEGSVSATPSGAESSVSLIPGQTARIGGGVASVSTLSEAGMDAAVAWRRGRLVLDELTVAAAAARIAEYHGCAISVSPTVGSLRLGGVAPLDDLSQCLATLGGVGNLEVIDLGQGQFRVTGR